MSEGATIVIISVVGSAITSLIVAKYYGERWVETRRNRLEHSTRLKDDFFKPWFEKIGKYNDETCRIGASYSKEKDRMVPLEPQEPKTINFYEEATSHLKEYKEFLKNWTVLKHETLKFNEELAILFEGIRVVITKEIGLAYWCPFQNTDNPDDYLCPDLFIRSIYDEVYYRLETGRKQYRGFGEINSTDMGNGKRIYRLTHGYTELANSEDEEIMKKAQLLFRKYVEDPEFVKRIKILMDKKRSTYDTCLDNFKQNMNDIIKSIELGNVIKGKCRFCP